MKRYQCIKNLWTFTRGKIYTEIDGSPTFEGGADLITHDGRIYEVTRTNMLEHFQELLDLHVDDIPRDEAYPEPFITPEPLRKLTAGWAWFLALIGTIIFL